MGKQLQNYSLQFFMPVSLLSLKDIDEALVMINKILEDAKFPAATDFVEPVVEEEPTPAPPPPVRES